MDKEQLPPGLEFAGECKDAHGDAIEFTRKRGVFWVTFEDGDEVAQMEFDAAARAAFRRLWDEAAETFSESQRFQASEARDILGTWDLADPGVVSRESVLADQVRHLLAIVDQVFPVEDSGQVTP